MHALFVKVPKEALDDIQPRTTGRNEMNVETFVPLEPGLHRHVSATEIHGITDADVADAPSFQDIAGELLDNLNGCVVAAYNVYFDIKFLNFEMQNAGVAHDPPHFCLMYMRPLLDLGPKCKLEEACRIHNIDFQAAHVAADDAMASAQLLKNYFAEMQHRSIRTFGDLTRLKNYKFLNSFGCDPYPKPSTFGLSGCGWRKTRRQSTSDLP